MPQRRMVGKSIPPAPPENQQMASVFHCGLRFIDLEPQTSLSAIIRISSVKLWGISCSVWIQLNTWAPDSPPALWSPVAGESPPLALNVGSPPPAATPGTETGWGGGRWQGGWGSQHTHPKPSPNPPPQPPPNPQPPNPPTPQTPKPPNPQTPKPPNPQTPKPPNPQTPKPPNPQTPKPPNPQTPKPPNPQTPNPHHSI